jgi:hypothetical protein
MCNDIKEIRKQIMRDIGCDDINLYRAVDKNGDVVNTVLAHSQESAEWMIGEDDLTVELDKK